MKRVDDTRSSHGSNDDTHGAKISAEGNHSLGRSTTKPGLSLTGPSKVCNKDFEHITPPVTPAPWTEVSSPTDAGLVPVSQQLLPLPPMSPEAGDSVGDYGRLKQDLVGEKGFYRSRVPYYGFNSKERNPSRLQSSDDRDNAADGRRDRLPQSPGGILEVIADAVSPAQACVRGKGKSRWNSSDQVTRTHSSTDGERDVNLDDEVTLPGPSFTQYRARNHFHNGCSGPPKIKGAEEKTPNNFVDSRGEIMGGVQSSALNYNFLHSSGHGSTTGVAGGQNRHEHITSVGGRELDSEGGLPQGEDPFTRTENFGNQETKGDGTGIDSDRVVCERAEHIRNGEATKNELLYHKKMKGWLDDEDEDDEEERFLSQSSAESSTKEDLPDPRLFRQSRDFDRRRSSLYSVHLGKGSLLGEARQAMPRPLLPKMNKENKTSAHLTQIGPLNAHKPFSSDQMARAQAITSGVLAENGERQEATIISNRDLTVQALRNHEAVVSSALSPNAGSRWRRSDKNNSVLRTLMSSEGSGTGESSVERPREDATTDTFSEFSSMSSRGRSSGAISEVHDLLEELGGPDIEDEMDRNNATEETEGAAVLCGGDAGKGHGDPSLPMRPLDIKGITSLSNNDKLREAMLLIDDLHFGKLPLIRQVELLRDISTVCFAKDEVIFSEGEPSDALYFILDRTDSIFDRQPSKGWRQASKTNKLVIWKKESGEGKACQLREFVPSGRIFGEEGLIYSSKYKRCSTICAAADTSCAVIRAPAFPHWWEFRMSLLMRKVAMLSQLSTMIRMKVLHALKYANFQPGETIIRQGELTGRFYIITRGTAIVSTTTSRDSALASASTSEDDTDADIDADASFGVGISSTFTVKSSTTYQPHLGDEHSREHVGGDVAPTSTQSLELPSPPTNAGEKVLTRLYEGNTFGERALVYDEPPIANVRAVTEMTCLFLEKDAFRTCLHDKAFHKLMEQATLQRPYYRKHRDGNFRQQLGLALGNELEVSQPSFSARARRPMERRARSSFRLTVKMKRKGKIIAKSNNLVNDYHVCEKVGEGSYGAVYKVVNVLTSKVYAMKVVNKPSKSGAKLDNFERTLMREVSVMKALRHPNVVTLWEVINDCRSRKVYMIQEFMAGGPLLKEDFNVEPIPEDEAVTVFIQVAKGLQYIHSFGVCHGDLKPSNILMDHNGRVKIADFGSCVFLDQDDEDEDGESGGGSSCSSNSEERCKSSGKNRGWRKPVRRSGQRVDGTPGFQAPELFEEDGTSRVSFASDVWALGITLYQMVVGRMPFFGTSFRALMSTIRTEELNFPTGCYIEPFLVNLLHRMLRKNPATRIRLDEVTRNEWVRGEGLRRPRLESRVQDAKGFRTRTSSAYSARTSPGSTSSIPPRRLSSPARLAPMDPLTMSPRESRSSPLPIDMNTGCYDDGHERKFSPRSIETLVDKRRSILPPGIIDDAQTIVLTRPSLSREVKSAGGKEIAPITQASNSNSGLPCAGLSSETPVPLGVSYPATQKHSQLSSFDNTTDPLSFEGKPTGSEGRRSELQMSNLGERASRELRPRSAPSRMWELQNQEQEQQGLRMNHSQLTRPPPSASRMTSPSQLLGASRTSWLESCNNRTTPGDVSTMLRDELDDSMALERSQRLARKPDFLMLKMNRTPMSNTRVVVSAKTGFSLVRPSGDGHDGSRRSSSRPTSLRHSFGGFGNAPGLQELLRFTPTGCEESGLADKKCSYEERALHSSGHIIGSSHVKSKWAGARQEPTRKIADDLRFIGSCNKQSLKGGPRGDYDSASSAASLLFPVNAERTGEAAANAIEDTVASSESVGPLTSYSTTPVDVGSGDNPAPHDAEGKRHPERARDAPDASEGTTGRWDTRTMVPFPSPTRQTHLFTAPQDPMDCIDEEEPEERRALPLHESVRYQEQASDGEARKETGDSFSSLDGGYDRDINKSSMSRIGVDHVREEPSHLISDGSMVDRSAKLMHSNDLVEELPYDSGESDSENEQGNVDSSTEDGLEEETSVADITDCLECIGEVGIKHDDKEILPLCHAEIRALIKGDVQNSLHSNSSGGGSEGAVSRPFAKVSAQPGEEDFGPVQARTWGGQVNEEVGVRFGVSLNQGNLCFMEDTATCLANIFEDSWRMTPDPPEVSLASVNTCLGASGATSGPSQEAASYFAVFDGHGGADVAIYLQDALHQRVLGDPIFPSNISEAISNGCKSIDIECLEITHGKREARSEEENISTLEVPTLKRQISRQNFPGAVSVMAIVHRPSLTPPASFDNSSASSGGTTNEGTSDGIWSSVSQHRPVFLHVANVGDCRAVLCRAGKAVAVTEDHTPAVASEATRIEAAGGFVSRGRVNGILGVSRSFGDIHCKAYPLGEGQDLWDGQQVISRPDVHSIEVTPADSFLILACDGVWGVLSNQQAVSFVHRRLLIHKDVQRAAAELIDKALEAPSYDNCSCVVVCLNQTTRVKKIPSRLSSGKSSGSFGSSRKSSTSSGRSGGAKGLRWGHA